MTRASEPRVVWAAVSAAEVAQIAETSWRRWPPNVPLRATATRANAVATARRFALEAGSGTVVKLEIDERLVEPHEVAPTPPISFDAEYREAASELEIRDVERGLGAAVPMPWRTYWRSSAWLRCGWMQAGAYVSLYTPSEALAYMRDWDDDRRGMFLLGSDGGGEMIVVDARTPELPVSLTPFVGSGWGDSIAQGTSLVGFISAIEDGTLDLRFP